MPTRTIDLTDDLDRFVENGVVSGRYGNVSEVVSEGLHLLEQREREDQAKLEWLPTAVQEGVADLERGNYVSLNSPEDVDALLGQIHEELTAESAAGRKID